MKAELKKTLWLAFPIVLGQLGQVLFGVMDNAMVGRLGALPLAASGFANTVTAIPMLFLIGVASSISVMVAKANGEGLKKDCGHFSIAGLSLLLVLILSLMLFFLFGPDFLRWFQQPEEVLEASRTYFMLIAWSMVPMVVFQGLRQFSVGLEKASVPTLILLVGLVVNFLLNYALIFGNWGAPELGLNGAGWATLCSRTVMALGLVALIYKSKGFADYRVPLRRQSFVKKYVQPIAKIGLTSGVQYLFEVGAFTAAGFMAGWVSTQALAAHQVSMNIGAITFMFAWGVSFAVSVRVGQAMGQKNLAAARERGFAGMLLIFCLMGFFGLVIIAFKEQIPSFYIQDPAVTTIAISLLLICAVFQVFDGVQSVAIGALRGMGDVTFPSIATLIIYWGVCIPSSYYFAFRLNWGAPGLWWGLTIGLVLAALTTGFRFHFLTTKSKKGTDHK